MFSYRSFLLPALIVAGLAAPAGAVPLINEIMYHPSGVPENSSEEWVEIYNSSSTSFDLSGWRFSRGVQFVFPQGTALASGGYLVVAANRAAFQTRYPSVQNVIGDWTGKLSNAGEALRLESASGQIVHEVRYADDGEWAARTRGPLSFGHRGWVWTTNADGAGSSLELRSATLFAEQTGQTWASSATAGGTPGAANSTQAANLAPLILDLQHQPAIPRSNQSIRVSARIVDETGNANATLRWRVDGASSFQSLTMTDTDADGTHDALIPPQPDRTIIEYYVQANDSAGSSRTFPAAVVGGGQQANALLQVDNNYDPATAWVPGDRPIYRIIMTAVERTELTSIQTDGGEEDSNAAMNATFISVDGTGIKTRYLTAVRNRGFGSRIGPPNNYLVSFRSDDLWNERASIQINCRYPHSQAIGALAFHRAGIPPQEAAPIRVRINADDLAETNLRMYGGYVRVEPINDQWAERHFPDDGEGNIYRLDDHAPNTPGEIPGDLGSGEFRYEGTNVLAYSDTYEKSSNEDVNDWSDLIELTDVLTNAPNAGYPQAIEQVLNLDEWLNFIATDALIGNQEGGLQSGRADDLSIYRGNVTRRFILVPHDFDAVFGLGLNGEDPGGPGGGGNFGNPVTRSIFSYDGTQGISRLFTHPEIVPRYYASVLAQMDDWFNRATLDPLIDQVMSPWVPAARIASVKAYVDQRRANVLNQIQRNYSVTVTTNAADVDGFKQTTDGTAIFAGTFNVAKTYSIRVNGLPATFFYRTSGNDAAGTWRFAATSASGFLARGLNKVVINFYDAPNGTGNIVQTFTSNIFYTDPAGGTVVGGNLSPSGSLAMVAPSSYLPGLPVLVRVDLRDALGNLDRTAWNRTATLSATNGVALTPATVQITNGIGSAMVSIGGGTGGTAQLVFPGGTTAAPNPNGPQWRMLDTGGEPAATWKSDAQFNDAGWTLGRLQAGAGDDDERTVLNNVPTGSTTRRAFYFRHVFNVANPASLTGLQIRAVVDDGAVFYLNGTEVRRENMPTGAVTITTPASQNRGGNAESTFNTYNISAFLSALRPGENLLAVEVHNFSNATTDSNDLSFDCELIGNTAASDPGNFTLTAAVGATSAVKGITSLGLTPPVTTVSGTLSGASLNWSGVIRVTGDVTVPTGQTLTIAPGTHVLIDGTPFGGGGSAGADLIVQSGGLVNASGSASEPINITSSLATTRWGEINTNGARTTWKFCLISRACHSPGGGHTGTGPVYRLGSGAEILIEDSVVSDSPGKTMTNSGAATITMRRSHFARCVMGPEIDSSAVTIEDSNFSEMLPAYRESGAADDEDCIYIHDSGGRPVILRRSVFANSGDDGIDCLAGSLTIEDSIIRNIFDKGLSLLQNNVTVRRSQIIDCDFGISLKTQIGDEASPYTTTLENCTIVSETHPTNQSDQSGGVYWHNVGIHVRNKYGTAPNPQLFLNVKNCIISAITPILNDYPIAGNDHPLTTVSYTCYQDLPGSNPVDPAPPSGVGNISADPQFLDATNKDFHLAAASPARDTGDPASPLDPDGSRADMGALPFGSVIIPGGEVRWTRAGSPYRVTSNTIVGPSITLRIDPGVSVLFNQNVRLTVNGRLLAQGTADSRITLSHVPGTVAPGDCDPIKNGIQTGPPKWGGIRIVDSLSQENIVSYADFINAQGTDPATSENYGSVGFIRSWGWADHLTFAGTHLRMCYGRNSKMTVTYCNFPDMFLFDSGLGRIEVPADFLAAADNRMEPLKVEFPTTDAELAGQTGSTGTFPNGLPRDGHWRVYFNQFHGNRGHQDVFDADSGRWQQSGQFVLDCRYNTFHGLTGDEHIDLGGDAYIAHNRFYSGSKDQWTIDTGYANAISSGDKGAGTTIMVARNVFFDLDHAINCKINTATIFEHNTLVDFHQDWQYNHTVTQNVLGSAVNLYVPNDGNAAGDGAYLAYNIFFGNIPAPDDTVSPDPPGGFPRLISWADQTIGGATTSVIRIENNFIDSAILDTTIGANHPGGIFAPAWGFGNIQGNPLFTDKIARDFTLRQGSPAKGTAPGGLDFGATVSEWAYILNAPPAVTASNAANLVIGGPGLVAYKWRLDNGPWSAPIQIGAGGVMPRTGAIVRQATLPLTGLSDGAHTLEVLGQDMAGNWQNADPARTIEGTPQFASTKVNWTVNSALLLVRINEVLVKSTTGAEAIELHNGGATDVNLTGWTMTNDPLFPSKYIFPTGAIIPAGGYITVPATASALLLDSDGDDLYLLRNGVLADSVVFGRQIANYSIGRFGRAGDWTLTQPTFGAANRPQALGEPAGLRINEWFASGNVLYEDDWIELANTGNLPVALAGLRLSDHRLADSAAHAIAPLSFIEPNGFARFFADSDPEKGTTHLSFSLDAEMENIALFDHAGAQIDLVFFFPQTSDLSQGRGAAGGYSFYELPTRGFANGSGDPAYAAALALLRGLRITEIMFNPIGGPEFEFVELRNIGAVPLQLGGVRFIEGIEFVFPPMLLNPGREVVIVANLQQFRGRYGPNVNVAGEYSGRLDNSGEKLAIQLPPPFDANLLTFVFEDEWFSSTDGVGRSLVVVNPLLPANVWGEKNSWLPSSSDGGNPDGLTIAPPETYLTWSSLYNVPGTLSDVDRDGVVAAVEFALGMNPTSAADGDGASGLPLVSRGTDGVLSMHVLIPANPLAMQTHGRPGVTYNVLGSSDLGTWSLIATKTTSTLWAGPGTVTVGSLAGGYAPVIIRDAPGPSSRRYLRLQIILAP